jgi:hypothetical protein
VRHFGLTLAESFAAIPINRHFGFRLIGSSPPEIRGELETQPWFARQGNLVHSGIATGLFTYLIGEWKRR